MEDYRKLQEEWLKKNKPTVCPTIDNSQLKMSPIEPLIEDGFVEEILEEKEPDKSSVHEEDEDDFIEDEDEDEDEDDE